MSMTVRKGPSLSTLRELTERACNDPQRMRARKTEAKNHRDDAGQGVAILHSGLAADRRRR